LILQKQTSELFGVMKKRVLNSLGKRLMALQRVTLWLLKGRH